MATVRASRQEARRLSEERPVVAHQRRQKLAHDKDKAVPSHHSPLTAAPLGHEGNELGRIGLSSRHPQTGVIAITGGRCRKSVLEIVGRQIRLSGMARRPATQAGRLECRTARVAAGVSCRFLESQRNRATHLIQLSGDLCCPTVEPCRVCLGVQRPFQKRRILGGEPP